ncbi:MAG: hypothetical protein LWX09_07250 [Bacteroidia bacterium]|nr:hypothetical protein [Bacteroidia bacterium]
MKVSASLFLMLVIGLTACKKQSNEELLVRNDPRRSAELRSSSEVHTIGNNRLELSTYLWRDFMPGTVGTDGSKLMGVIRLQDAQGAALSNSIKLRRLHVVKGNEIWTTGFAEVRSDDATILEGVVRNGPYWGPSINVDVICEFDYLGKSYFIQAKSQPIHRTD